MHRSIALVFLALSCVTAFPVVFLTYEGEAGEANQRLFDCVSTAHAENSVGTSTKRLSYKCRPHIQAHATLKFTEDFPVFELLEEPAVQDVATVMEVGEIELPPALPLFPASKVIVAGSGATKGNTKYEVVGEKGKRKNRGGCDDDEVFVAELDLCMPYSPMQAAPRSASFTKESEESTVVEPTHKILKVGYAPTTCGEGEMFLPSVGICAPINNCYPHPNCDHLTDKDKDKEGEGSATATETEGEDAATVPETIQRSEGEDDDDDDK